VDLIDEEVFAVLLAVIVIGSVFAAAQEFKRIEPFNAIGLLNEDCKIGDYPSFVLIGENLTLCIYIYNHMGKPEAFKVVHRFGDPSTLPTNTTPSAAQELWSRIVVLDHGREALIRVSVPIPYRPDLVGRNATLIFELWIYRPGEGWIYTGRWVHLHVRVEGVPAP